jgi:hypothetical protein
MMRTLSVLFFLCLGLTLASCGGEEDLPKAWDQYFPAKAGDWQIFRRMTFTTDVDTVDIGYDSVHYHSTTMINGREAIIGVVYNPESGVPRDTLYHAVLDNGAYRYYNPASFQELSSFSFEPQWTLFANFNDDAAEWKTLDTSLTDIPFKIGDQTFTGSGTVRQGYKPNGEHVVVLDNNDHTPVQARQFVATTSYDFKLLVSGDSVPVRFDNIERLYFSKGRGLVKHERSAYTVNVDSILVPVNGFERLMRANYAN